jgi:RNA-directed DNA polymerase
MTVRNSPQWLAWTLGIELRLLQSVAIGIEEMPERYYRHEHRQTATNKIREIDEPIEDLRFIQGRIKERLLAVFPFPATFHGCVPRRSSKSNAKVHQRSVCLVRLDLADYYPHATSQMVYDAWQRCFQVGPPIAALLTRLTTVRGHLPQGAVTSGYVGNLVLLSVSTRIEAVAESLGCSVTFYVDDIAFSGAKARQ